MGVAELIRSLRSTLERETSEELVESLLKESLSALRKQYRADSSRFTDEQVAFLQTVRDIQEAVSRFVGLRDDLDAVLEPSDAMQVRRELESIARTVGHIPVQKRILCEMRRLSERMPELERSADERASNKLDAAIARLEREAPACSTCRKPMVLRESNYGHFWGCSQFPACYGRQRLTAAHRRQLS